MLKKTTLPITTLILVVSLTIAGPLYGQKGKKGGNHPRGATLVFADEQFDAIASDGQGPYVDGLDGSLDWDRTNSQLSNPDRAVYFDFSNSVSGSGEMPAGTPGYVYGPIAFNVNVGTVPMPGQTVTANAGSMLISTVDPSYYDYAVNFRDENGVSNVLATGVDLDDDGTTDAIRFTISAHPSEVFRFVRTRTKGNKYTVSTEAVGYYSLPFSATLIRN